MSTMLNAQSIEEKTILVDGRNIPYTAAGAGPVLVLVHGGLSNHTLWQNHIPLLAQDFRVVAFPLRYYSDGDWGEAPKGVPYFVQAAEDLAQFVKALNMGPVHLVGWSMGGVVAHQASINHPEVVKSTYLFEGSVPLAGQQTGSGMLTEIMTELSDLAQSGEYADLAKLVWEELATNSEYENLPVDIRNRIEKYAESYASVLKSTTTPPLPCDVSKQAKHRIRLVRGSESTDPLKEWFSDDWADCVELFTLEGANHLWPSLSIKDFVSDVTSFALAQ